MNQNHRRILSWLAEADDSEAAAVLALLPFLSPAPGAIWLENEGKRFCYETFGPSMKEWHYGPPESDHYGMTADGRDIFKRDGKLVTEDGKEWVKE